MSISKDSTKWWIGTFPSWLVTGLLALITYFAAKTYDKVEAKFRQIDEVIVPRLVRVETKVEGMEPAISEIRIDIREIKTNIKRIQ